MATRALAGRWLPVATLVGVLLAAALATLYGGLHRTSAPPAPVAATATVLESAPCGRSGARDTVVFVIDGRSYRMPLDACGNPEGIQLDVELVVASGRGPAVRLAGTGAAPHNVLAERISAVLLVLAGLGGALLVVLVSPSRTWPRPREW